MLVRFFSFDCRSSARAGNAFAVSAKHGNSDRKRKRKRKRHTTITRAGFDSFANSAATYRRAFQKSESALDRTRSDGRSCLGHSD
jgi:hypothetical protein